VLSPPIDFAPVFMVAVIEFAVATAVFVVFRVRKVTLLLNLVLVLAIALLAVPLFADLNASGRQVVVPSGNYLVSALIALLVLAVSFQASKMIRAAINTRKTKKVVE
jgi:fucose 4-O-acetylase-like acetyltransferase